MENLYMKVIHCIDNDGDIKDLMIIFNKPTIKNESRIALALKHLRTHNLLPFQQAVELKSDKSSIKSIDYRNTGNTLYAKKDLMGALSYYSKSIAAAPYPRSGNDKSDELAVAFANRSAVLFAVAKYEACLYDIDHALKFAYPEKLKFKLLERQGKCCQYLGKFSEASTCIQKSIDCLPMATSLSKEVLNKTLLRLKILLVEISKMSQKSPARQTTATTPDLPSQKETFRVGNVALKFSKEASRYIVASCDIKPGEVVVAEDPYASVLLPEFYSTHCFNCLRRFNALIPCKTCSLAMFCDEKCQDTAWMKYHKIECPILPLLLELDMGYDWLLALRLLLIALHRSGGIKIFQENIDKLLENLDDFEKFEQLFKSDPEYGTMHCLTNNYTKRTFKDAYKVAIGVACIINCLEVYTDLFSAKTEQCIDNPEIFVGGLLMQYVLSLQCNSYTVAELLFETTNDRIISTIQLGCAVYKFASLINHSCDPNVVRSNHTGDCLAITASRPIKKGEQVCCDYGYQFSEQGLVERQTALQSKYFFDCTCPACANDWPVAAALDSLHPTFLCTDCHVALEEDRNAEKLLDFTYSVCYTCQKKFKFSDMWEEYQNVVESYYKIKTQLLAGSVSNFTPELAQMSNTLDKIVQRPSKLVIDVQEAFRHNAMQLGNFYHSL